MIRRPPRSTLSSSSAASDVYKRQVREQIRGDPRLLRLMDWIENGLSALDLDGSHTVEVWQYAFDRRRELLRCTRGPYSEFMETQREPNPPDLARVEDGVRRKLGRGGMNGQRLEAAVQGRMHQIRIRQAEAVEQRKERKARATASWIGSEDQMVLETLSSLFRPFKEYAKLQGGIASNDGTRTENRVQGYAVSAAEIKLGMECRAWSNAVWLDTTQSKPTGEADIVLTTMDASTAVSYTHLRAHETPEHLVCRLLLEKKKKHDMMNKEGMVI
eukprot:TRINITY_DN38710_c0_g1_i1.p1 TRINITY_DN38710_c0_g1~~TRINITY_DN38710_c0_g1_i1.p1  ORF type:complete len:273 (+),score=66.46 TRINITY_DN38710_c0_g1_i1:54-872(+)